MQEFQFVEYKDLQQLSLTQAKTSLKHKALFQWLDDNFLNIFQDINYKESNLIKKHLQKEHPIKKISS